MTFHPQLGRRFSRRHFFGLAGGAAALAFVACGEDEESEAKGTGTAAANTARTIPEKGTVLVGDVLEYSLERGDWAGDFGFVTFRLHEGFVDGESQYFIRTDASDRQFAIDEKLVYVPIMSKALDVDAGWGRVFIFDDNRLPVFSNGPHMDGYSPAWRVYRVSGGTGQLSSAGEIDAAAGAGDVDMEETDIVVNYPVVKWPGGELQADTVREVYLGDGQLLEPVDTGDMRVTFKLHSCYPASRYIVTDVTMPSMADGMHIAPAPGAEALTAAGATAKILVFGNGIDGSGPMGFQKSVTDTSPGDDAWSPYWDHYTFVWGDGAQAEVLKSESAITDRESAGALERFPGTPDTNGTLFMVNCPVPIVAPVA